MLNPIVIATSNRNKLAEIETILGSDRFQLQSQKEFGLRTPVEDGSCFSENAMIKARHACNHTGLAAIGDDSGLEVDILDGQPGVRSSRYAGENASDADNLELLLKRVERFPPQRLTARFRCTVAYIDPDLRSASRPLIIEASWEGRLLKSPRGKNGFGYDPIFFVEEYSCTAAELSPAVKNKISHRAQAFSILRDRLINHSA